MTAPALQPKICVLGAGAVGCHLAARLARTGAHLTVAARGDTVGALERNGITLRSNGETLVEHVNVISTETAVPQFDVVFTTVKATSLPGACSVIEKLLRSDGTLACVLNGVPWWWNHGLNSSGPLLRLDPGGALWDKFRSRTIGVTLTSANTLRAAGVVEHNGPNNWFIGEPDGLMSDRLARVVELLQRAAIDVASTSAIRRPLWHKLVLNSAFNPLGALTGLYGSEISQDEALKNLALAMMRETLAIGCALRVASPDLDLQQLASGHRRATSRPSSMLQDVLLGRRLEVESILGQTLQMGRELSIASPHMSLVYDLLRGRDHAIARAT